MSEKRRRVEVVPLILALLPLLALLLALAYSVEPDEAFGDVVREVPPGSTEPGTYRPVTVEPAGAGEFLTHE